VKAVRAIRLWATRRIPAPWRWTLRTWLLVGQRAYHALRPVPLHADPVLVFGQAKAGTTAIAALLARHAGLEASLDPLYRYDPFGRRRRAAREQGRSIAGQIRAHSFLFAAPVLKDPGFLAIYDDLRTVFPSARQIMIVRDPRDNLRSLLNGRGIRGDLERSPDLPWIHAHGRLARWSDGGDYIGMMAEDWNTAVDGYLARPDVFILIRYEDFVADKVGAIARLAAELGLPAAQDIDAWTDVQYQPRGDRDISWQEFFGPENLARIERICGDRMARFGYHRTGPDET